MKKYILLDQNSYLIQEYKNFYEYLKQKFKCNDDQCDIKLLYLQLIDSSVISELYPELKNFKELNTLLKTNFYPFDISPEMKIFYDNDYKKNSKFSFDEVKPNLEQIDRLLNLNSEYCLLKINKSLEFLHINKTEDNQKKIDNYFVDFNYDKINYLTEYFYNYLPKIFFYYQINSEDNNNAKINAEESLSYGLISKTITNFIPLISQKIYNNSINIDLLSYIITPLTFIKIKEKINYTETDEICPINKNCDNSIKDYFKQIIYISETEIDSILTEKSIIHEAFKDSLKQINKIYNCKEKCGNDYLLKLQFANCEVTRNAPDPIPIANSSKEWFPELEEEFELPFIIKKYNKSNINNYNYEDALLIADLCNININDLYDLNNADIFYKKIQLEKKLLNEILNIKNEDEESISYNLFNFLMNTFIFNNEDISKSSIIINYSSINNFLEGNNEINNYWINILNQGNYYENFKPKKSSVTKFNIGFNFDTKLQEDLNLDYIGISTKNSDYNKRKYTKMNNLLTLNIQKEEYDYFLNKTINTSFPLYNFEKLLDSRKFSDGFQYDNNLEVIYYYDLISTRPLRFIKDETLNYKDKIECKKYKLDPKNPLNVGINELFDLDSEYSFLSQKTNKPFIISDKINILEKYEYKEIKQDDFINYICVDPINDMVIDSKINLIYALNTRKYNILNTKINSDNNYPLFLYQKNFEVDVSSYEILFPGVTEYYEKATTFIIIGVVIIILAAAIAIVAFIYLNKKLKVEKTDETINSGDVKPIDQILISKVDDNKN